MGSAFELIVGHDEAAEAKYLLDIGIQEITRIENLLSEFRENTFTSALNRNAGIEPVAATPEVYSLIERCHQISTITRGAFDITVGPLKKLYRFKNSEFTFPGNKEISETLGRVGYSQLLVNPAEHTVFLPKRGMSISFAGIGKGYAADCVRKLWLKHGVGSGVISASGDLCTIGNKADGSPWKIGIADPDDKEKMLFFIPVHQAAVATSGDYEQYFMHRGIRYSHNINPVSGRPVTGIKSVSIFSPGAELSDALATAVYIMGVETGLHFVNQLPDTHCLIIDDRNRTHHSKQINIQYEKQ